MGSPQTKSHIWDSQHKKSRTFDAAFLFGLYAFEKVIGNR